MSRKKLLHLGLATLLAAPGCMIQRAIDYNAAYNENKAYYDQHPEARHQLDEQFGKELVGGDLTFGGNYLMEKAIQQRNPKGFVYGREVRNAGRNLANQPTGQQEPQQEQPQQVFIQQPQTSQGLDEFFLGERTVGSWICPPASFTCSSYSDKNDDGFIGKDELDGLGSYFSCKEKNITTNVICGAVFDNVRGRKITGIVKDGKTGEIIKVDEDESKLMVENGRIRGMYQNFYKAENDKGIHPYEVNWLVDGRILPTRTVNFFVDYGE